MNKILIIIWREYITRVKKKSFLIMTFAGPLLIAGLYGLAIWTVISDIQAEDVKQIAIIDDSKLFVGKLENNKSIKYVFVDDEVDEMKQSFAENKDASDYYCILHIPVLDLKSPKGIRLYGNSQPNITVISQIEKQLENIIEEIKLTEAGIDKSIMESIQTKIEIGTIKLTDGKEEESNTAAALGVGIFAAFLIYFFIFLYGVQVMRGVLEEKTNRIVEIIISSVKPFQLMMGKIVGVAMVGLTQFLLWVGLVALITTIINSAVMPENMMDQNVLNTLQNPDINKNPDIDSIMTSINSLNLPFMISVFIFYFLGGYLLYSSLFAAIGAAVDSEADTQQFIFPLTIPLIFAFIVAQSVLRNPDTSLAFWMSVIPFTSPVIMMARLPFGVPAFELVISMIFLVLGFILTTWIASKIYKTGILMYGKKPSFKEMWKWLFY